MLPRARSRQGWPFARRAAAAACGQRSSERKIGVEHAVPPLVRRTTSILTLALLLASCTDPGASLAPDGDFTDLVDLARGGRGRKPVRVQVSPDTVVIAPGSTTTFVAVGVLSDGKTRQISVSWKATGGTIDSTGAFKAGAVPGHYRVSALFLELTDTAAVTVSDSIAPAPTPPDTVAPGPTVPEPTPPDTSAPDTSATIAPVASVSVSLASSSLIAGQTTQATTTVYDSSKNILTGRIVTLSSSNEAVAKVSSSGVVSAVAAGTAAISATSEGKTGHVTLTVLVPPRSPSPSVCAGTSINPGEDWAAKVSAGTSGTVFCIQAGTHRRQSVIPKSGQQFIGEPGAIMDGENVTAFAFSGSASGILIKHLVIQRYAPPDGAKAMIHGDAGRGWVVDSNEIAYSSQQGVRVGDHGKIRWNYVHHNGVMGIGLYRADSVLIENNRLAFNPATFVSETGATARASQMKIFETVGVIVRGNLVEDGPKKGIWLDTDNHLALVEGNTIRRQGQAGIWYEANYAGIIRNNIVAACGSMDNSSWVANAGIQVTNSQPVEIAGNSISGCENGITGMSVAATSGHQYYSGNRGLKALGMNVHDNTVTQPSGLIGVRATGIADSVFHNGRIKWQNNTYTLSGNAAPFTWLNQSQSKGEWQKQGHDSSATFLP